MSTVVPTGLPLYRWAGGGMQRHDLGDYVKLTDARHAMNAMESALRSTEIGSLAQNHPLTKAHKDRGDMLRLWAIVGDPNTRGVKADIFECVQYLKDLTMTQAAEIAELRNRLATVHSLATSTEMPERRVKRIEMIPRVECRVEKPTEGVEQ